MYELEKIVIPASVETIREGCFSGDSKLETIIFEDSKKKIILGGTLISSDPMFQDCPVRNIYMGRNILEKTPYKYDGYQISPFLNSTTLENVQIGNEVTIIGNDLFMGCSNIGTITIPNSVHSIGRNAFSLCSGLTSVTITNSVTSIGENAFLGCTNLTNINIGTGVSYIYSKAFSECKKLESLTCNTSNVPFTWHNVFEGSNVIVSTLFVPEYALNNYKNTPPWSEFGTFLPIASADVKNIILTQVNNTPFNLSGIKAKDDDKGIVIRNGKKCVNK